jgi:putative flippase GtrA
MLKMAATRTWAKPGRIELVRYFVASVFALLVDIALLMLLTQAFAIHYLAANVLSFVSGSIVAYLISTHWVFEKHRLSNKPLEYLIFVLIGVLGLGVNEAALWTCMEVLVWSLLPAKLVSACISFLFNFAARKILLFT